MGWLDTMMPKRESNPRGSDDYMYMVHGSYTVAEADDKTVYFSGWIYNLSATAPRQPN